MTQTLKTLINTVAAEVYELQDTKADRIELNAYIRTVNPDNTGIDFSGNPTPQLVNLVKTGNVLSINSQSLRATLQQLVHQQRGHRQRRPLPAPEHHLRRT